MTNNYAIQVELGKTPHIFCVTDSQASFSPRRKEPNAPKLVQHGHNLIMSSGRGDIVNRVYTHLSQNDVTADTVSAQELAIALSTMFEEMGIKIQHQEDSTYFLVMGRNKDDKDKLQMYEVSIICRDIPGKPYDLIPVNHDSYGAGSGSAYVRAALERDGEMGFFATPSTALEAMYLLFLVGKKAGTDIGVNEKLQLGFISPAAVRVLRAPGVQHPSREGLNRYIESLTSIKGIISPEFAEDFYVRDRKSESDRYTAISRTLDDFYYAWETQMYRLLNRDFKANAVHTRLKSGEANIADYERAMQDRKIEVEATQPVVEAFMQGGIENIVTALRQFRTGQDAFYEAALQAGAR